jgi:hypothetical protein
VNGSDTLLTPTRYLCFEVDRARDRFSDIHGQVVMIMVFLTLEVVTKIKCNTDRNVVYSVQEK